MSRQRELVVIGGGHNGLTVATLAARAGRDVLLLERREEVGGLAAGEEFHPGYRSTGVLLSTAGVRSWAVEELELSNHGLARRPAPKVLVPRRDGEAVVVGQDIGGVSDTDRASYRALHEFVDRIRPVVRRFTDRPPPDLLDAGALDLLRLGLTGFALRRLGRGTMSELLRVAPTSVADWLDESFDSPALKAALAAPALWAGRVGPRAPGTTANLLLALAAAEEPVRGGPAALVAALERAARAAGAEIRTGAEVEALRVDGDAVAGVRLSGGEEIGAARVAASCDPKQLFLRLVPPPARSRRLTADVASFRARGAVARVDLALSGYPGFTGRDSEVFEAIRVGETLDELERAADAVKYRRLAERPMLEVRVPTIETPGLAPPGHHVFSLLVGFAPHDLDGGWDDAARRALVDRTLDRLAEHAPDTRRLLVGHRVLTPVDLERRYGLTGGHLFHGEHALDQLLVRPVPDCARYETPIEGLILCGSGSHPGGGLTCAPGALATKAIVG